MALYGFYLETISRQQGGSAAKKAAYMLREKLYDEYEKKTCNYSYLKDLIYSEMLLPENAPHEFYDLQTLLRAMEKAEKRYDARIGRMLRLTLPNDQEVTVKEKIELVKGFLAETCIRAGMCALIAIHEGKNEDPEKNNPHAHVLLTDRPVDANGFCAKKNREWNQVRLLQEWRKQWADAQNRLFKEKGLDVRVSHDSYEVQGIDREPTKPLGREITALERRGIRTERGDENRDIIARNQEREEQKQRQREHSRSRGRERERSR